MLSKLKRLGALLLPLFVASVFSHSILAAELSQKEKLILIQNITRLTGWKFHGERERNGQVYYRFNSDDGNYLLTSDLRGVNEDLDVKLKLAPGSEVKINSRTHTDFHFPGLEIRAAMTMVQLLPGELFISSATTNEEGRTTVIFKIKGGDTISMYQPSRYLHKVMKYGKFQSIHGQIVFDTETKDQLTQQLKVTVDSISQVHDQLIRITSGPSAILINSWADLEDPKIFERARTYLTGAAPLADQIALQRIAQIKGHHSYIGAQISQSEVTYTFKNSYGTIESETNLEVIRQKFIADAIPGSCRRLLLKLRSSF